jgi:hypothetical protein
MQSKNKVDRRLGSTRLGACVFGVVALLGMLSNACSGSAPSGFGEERDEQGGDGETSGIVQQAEGEEFGYGALEDTPEDLAGSQMPPPPPPPPLPAAVDLASLLPPPGNQGGQGSCVGWATAYAAQSFNEMDEWGWSGNQKRYQFSPAWIYNQINGGNDNGSKVSTALKLIVSSGLDSLQFFPYSSADFTTQPSSSSMTRATRFKAASWNSVNTSPVNLKSVLASGKVIVVRFDVYPDFSGMNAANPVYDSTAGARRGGHAVALVGYDDSMNAFKLINSWGTGWAAGGYGWIDYDFLTDAKLKFKAYLLNDAADSPPGWPHLYYVRNALYRVDKEFGSWFRIGTSSFTGSTSLGYLSSNLYVIRNGSIYRTSLTAGTSTKISGTTDWSGPTKMTAIGSWLFVIQNNRLHRVDPTTGAYTLLGTTTWGTATAIAFADNKLFIVKDDTLYKVDTGTGAPTALATGWTGPVGLVGPRADAGFLYGVQGDMLWKVINYNTGARTRVGTEVFPNLTAMTADFSSIFLIQNNNLVLVDLGGKSEILGPAGAWPGAMPLLVGT